MVYLSVASLTDCPELGAALHTRNSAENTATFGPLRAQDREASGNANRGNVCTLPSGLSVIEKPCQRSDF